MGCLKLHIIEEEFLQECGSYIPLRHNIAFDKNDSKHCISDDIGCAECYRYSFQGQEKDDEVKGEGNSLNFGARIYDPRLGRWMSTDPYKHLYVPISPYSFALNSPIKLLDADGNIIVDEKGNPVTITVTKNDDGSYSASYAFVEGTKKEVIDKFNENGGRLISTLIQVPTGREMVEKSINIQDNIHIVISDENKLVEEDVDGVTIIKGALGRTRETARIHDTEENLVALNVEVTIYEGSINKYTEYVISEYEENNLTQDQKVARTGAHELQHATGEIDRQANIDDRKLTKEEHKVAEDIGTKVSEEFGEINKSTDK
jgi:RHS repeat-associated protein